jgi:hypothetical protein
MEWKSHQDLKSMQYLITLVQETQLEACSGRTISLDELSELKHPSKRIDATVIWTGELPYHRTQPRDRCRSTVKQLAVPPTVNHTITHHRASVANEQARISTLEPIILHRRSSSEKRKGWPTAARFDNLEAG